LRSIAQTGRFEHFHRTACVELLDEPFAAPVVGAQHRAIADRRPSVIDR
jgi:hypothetical protein